VGTLCCFSAGAEYLVLLFSPLAVILGLESLRATVSCFGSFIPLRAAHVAVLLLYAFGYSILLLFISLMNFSRE
jgi:hypothetical protein